LDRRLGGPQSRYGRGGEEKNSQPLPGLEPPIIQPVAQRYTTELSKNHENLSTILYIKHVYGVKVKMSGALTEHHAMEVYWGVEV
jgi:hypothetical protein